MIQASADHLICLRQGLLNIIRGNLAQGVEVRLTGQIHRNAAEQPLHTEIVTSSTIFCQNLFHLIPCLWPLTANFRKCQVTLAQFCTTAIYIVEDFYNRSMEINTILSQIDLGSYAMPVFQRGYVWNRDQVRKLMNSLYKGYPIGELLVWNTATDPGISRGDGPLTPGNVNLILDGQQRMTSLYGVIRGEPPKFFDGNSNSFTGLYFNVEDETFEFYMAAKMKNDPSWISVVCRWVRTLRGVVCLSASCVLL